MSKKKYYGSCWTSCFQVKVVQQLNTVLLPVLQLCPSRINGYNNHRLMLVNVRSMLNRILILLNAILDLICIMKIWLNAAFSRFFHQISRCSSSLKVVITKCKWESTQISLAVTRNTAHRLLGMTIFILHWVLLSCLNSYQCTNCHIAWKWFSLWSVK